MALGRDFYLRDANIVALELLGKVLVHKTQEGVASGMIVEVESYIGPDDKAAHSYLNRRTPRTEIQFGSGGFSYVYSIYGLHCCFNVVTNIAGRPEVVLIRALEPIDGIELMQKRRRTENMVDLCNGPGKLCAALNISISNYADDLCGDTLFIMDRPVIPTAQIMASPRINIDYAEEWKDRYMRFYISNNRFVSKVAKRYSADSINAQEVISKCNGIGE